MKMRVQSNGYEAQSQVLLRNLAERIPLDISEISETLNL